VFSKLYLDRSLNYLYTDMYHKLLSADLATPFELNMLHFNQLDYTLSLLNSYFKHAGLSHAEFVARVLNNSGQLLSKNDWFYFLNALLVIDLFGEECLCRLSASSGVDLKQYESMRNLTRGLRVQFDKLIFESGFMQHLLDSINTGSNNQRFLTDLVLSDSRVELNNVSLFLHGFLTKTMADTTGSSVNLVAGLNKFALGLFKNSSNNNNEQLVLFLYEIPFAKYSILDSLNKVQDHVEHYYNVFAKLIEDLINSKLNVLGEQLKTGLASNESLSLALNRFNSTLNVVTKYVGLYFELMAESADADSKFYAVFNLNEKTSDFLQNVLSRLLIRILDLFIDLKAGLKSPNGFFFFFNFEKESIVGDGDFQELRWNQVTFLDKLNKFITLFFTPLNRKHEELSIYLSEKHWDFILCYTSSLVQGLNRTLAKTSPETVYLQIFSANLFELLNAVVRTVKYKVTVDSESKYPKNISSDWLGFFSKEIFDHLLQIYVRLTIATNASSQAKAYLANQGLRHETSLVLSQLSALVSEITFDRLLLNVLEPNFNVLDMDMSGGTDGQQRKKRGSVNLPDSLKTLLNYLIPNLKHQAMPVQLSSYAILRTIMKEANKYYGSSSSKTDSGVDG
jgi:hypothetical protein